MYNSIWDAVKKHALETPDKLAIADENRAYSYRELETAVRKAASVLKSYQLNTGDRVLVECMQDTNFIVINLACQYSGVVFVPVEKKMTSDRVVTIYEEAQGKCIISELDYSDIGKRYSYDDFNAKLENASVCEMEDASVNVGEILFSTGTTGKPKGIVISPKANVAIAENISFGVEMKQDTVEIVPLMLSHSHGLRTCYANLLNGSAVVIIDGIMNVGLFFELIERHNVNAFDISPTLGKLLLKIAKRGIKKMADSIDYIEIGTAVLENDVKNNLKEILPNTRLYNFYGSTEAGRSCVLNFNEFDETGCVGYPSKNSKFYVVNEDREPINSSKENTGLIAVSGSMMMNEYLGAPELTKATVVDGIMYTSDLGYIDENGRVYVLGRADDVINYKGIKIAPEEIEGIAIKFAGITDCACVPLKDDVCGQVPKLFVSVENSEKYDEKEFLDFLKENLNQARVPAVIEVIDVIPRSANGKLLRKQLRDN